MRIVSRLENIIVICANGSLINIRLLVVLLRSDVSKCLHAKLLNVRILTRLRHWNPNGSHGWESYRGAGQKTPPVIGFGAPVVVGKEIGRPRRERKAQ